MVNPVRRGIFIVPDPFLPGDILCNQAEDHHTAPDDKKTDHARKSCPFDGGNPRICLFHADDAPHKFKDTGKHHTDAYEPKRNDDKLKEPIAFMV